jgi:hypothetical protein
VVTELGEPVGFIDAPRRTSLDLHDSDVDVWPWRRSAREHLDLVLGHVASSFAVAD